MPDNRRTLGYAVVSVVWGGLSWCKDEGFLCNTNPSAQAFPSRKAAQEAITATLRFARQKGYQNAGWYRRDYRIVRVVAPRP